MHGRLGKIIRTKGYGVHALWGPSGWFTEARYAGGGAMADVGVHALDTARFLLGDPQPVSVYARIGTYYTKQDVDDTGILIVNWDNDAAIVYRIGLVAAPHRWSPTCYPALWRQSFWATISNLHPGPD